VLRRSLKIHDATLRYEFRINGGKATTLSVNDDHEHVSRASMPPTKYSIRNDDHNHPGPDKAEVFETQKVAIASGEWHTLVIELRGPEMAATLDRKHTTFGSNSLLSYCQKLSIEEFSRRRVFGRIAASRVEAAAQGLAVDRNDPARADFMQDRDPKFRWVTEFVFLCPAACSTSSRSASSARLIRATAAAFFKVSPCFWFQS
jgi:hypothetical protein